MSPSIRYSFTAPALQDLRQKLYDAEDLTLILQRLDEADFLVTDPPTAHVATLAPLIRQRINEAVKSLDALESRRHRPTS